MPSYVKCITGDKPPKNAVQAGYDDGPSYHARGVVNGLTIPGKVGVRSEKDLHLVGACIPYGTKEHRVNSFEVLTDDKSAFTYVRYGTTRFWVVRQFLYKSTVNSLLTDTSVSRTSGVGPCHFSVISL